MSRKVKGADKFAAEVGQIRKEPENKTCFICRDRGPNCVVLQYCTFVCMACSGIHREFNHRIVSISMYTWTELEVQRMREGGNQVARDKWLGGKKSKCGIIESDTVLQRQDKIRNFIRQCFVVEAWVQRKSKKKKKKNKESTKGEARSNLQKIKKKKTKQGSDADDSDMSSRRAEPTVSTPRATPPLKQLSDVLPDIDKLVVTTRDKKLKKKKKKKKKNQSSSEEERDAEPDPEPESESESEPKKKKKGRRKKSKAPTLNAPVEDSSDQERRQAKSTKQTNKRRDTVDEPSQPELEAPKKPALFDLESLFNTPVCGPPSSIGGADVWSPFHTGSAPASTNNGTAATQAQANAQQGMQPPMMQAMQMQGQAQSHPFMSQVGTTAAPRPHIDPFADLMTSPQQETNQQGRLSADIDQFATLGSAGANSVGKSSTTPVQDLGSAATNQGGHPVMPVMPMPAGMDAQQAAAFQQYQTQMYQQYMYMAQQAFLQQQQQQHGQPQQQQRRNVEPMRGQPGAGHPKTPAPSNLPPSFF